MPSRFPNVPATKSRVRRYQRLQFLHSLGKLLVHFKHINLVYVEHRTKLVVTNNLLLVIGVLKTSKELNQLLAYINTCHESSLGMNMLPHLLDDLWSGHG